MSGGIQLDTFGRDPLTHRTLYLMTAEKPEDFADTLEIAEHGFVCLIAWDAGDVSDEVITRVVQSLLDAGTKYVCSWGSDCERVHDLVDQASFDPEADYEVDPVIMTTWHDDESLEDAVYFFLTDANPDDDYAEDCTGAVAVTVGNRAYTETIRNAFADPDEFRRRIVDEES